jgi:hypothetical protein
VIDGTLDLLIDRMARDAAHAPQAPLLPRFTLTNAEAWAQTGGVASWLIAQGFGPGALSIAVSAAASAERAVLLLGALRGGALVVEAVGEAALAVAIRPPRQSRRYRFCRSRALPGRCRSGRTAPGDRRRHAGPHRRRHLPAAWRSCDHCRGGRRLIRFARRPGLQ